MNKHTEQLENVLFPMRQMMHQAQQALLKALREKAPELVEPALAMMLVQEGMLRYAAGHEGDEMGNLKHLPEALAFVMKQNEQRREGE